MTSPITSDTKPNKQNPVFRDFNAEEDPEVTEIESLCLHCQENGITRLLLTKIPFYKDVVIMSFACEHCHWQNNELQPAAKIQDKGVMYKLNVQNAKDLARTIVKTEWASITIPELEFEIPSQSQEGTVTNIEGIIERTSIGIQSKIEYLKKDDRDPDSASKLEDFLKEMEKLRSGNSPFSFFLRDCSGNSFVENLCAPQQDPQLEVIHFEISREESLLLGISVPDEDPSELADGNLNLCEEVLGLPTNCYSCNAPCMTNMKMTHLPHFKEVVIMSTLCESCGHKTNEIKSGCGIEPHGTKFTLKIEEHRDLTRDLVKSDSCRISIKELDLDVGPAAFTGRYTTVEGILTIIKEQLKESNPFITGDSADLIRRERMEIFLQNIDEIISGERKVTFIMDDPCGNSYLQSLDDLTPDVNLIVEKYERSEEQNDELGLLDMKVEGYEEES